MADDVWRWCERLQAFGRTVAVKVAHGNVQQIARSRSRPAVVVTHGRLRHAAIDPVRWVAPAAKGIGLVCVTLSDVAEAAVAKVGCFPIFAELGAT